MLNRDFQNHNKKEFVIIVLLFALCILAAVLGLFTLSKKPAVTMSLEEDTVINTLKKDRIAVVGLEGVIYDGFYSKSPFRSNLTSSMAAREYLKKAVKDKHIKAVLLRMNSPGGTVAASQEIYQLVRELQANRKPVVVSMGDVCASGCYYIASAADKIVANPGTLTGSIGVISQGVNVTGLFEKLGIQNQTFKAGKYKDLGSSQRPITEEEQKIMQALLDNSYEQFLSDIEAARKIPKEQLGKIAQGLIYTGTQALDVHLVDSLGTYENAKSLLVQILSKDYGYTKADNLNFEETWSSSRLTNLDDLFDIGLNSLVSLFLQSESREAIGFAAGPALSLPKFNVQDLTVTKYQPLWLLPTQKL
jgi:protease-4